MTREQIINKIMDEINKHLSDNASGTVTLDLSTNDIRDILKKHLPQPTGVDALVENKRLQAFLIIVKNISKKFIDKVET
jgi:hypothetical protein